MLPQGATTAYGGSLTNTCVSPAGALSATLNPTDGTIGGYSEATSVFDIPSGLHGDTGVVLGACCHADVTVTFVGKKFGMTTPNGRAHCGKIVVVGLGLPETAARRTD